MRPRNSVSRWFAAAICVLATSGFVAAEEGVVRIGATNGSAGVVQMHASASGMVQHASLDSATVFNRYRYGGAAPAQQGFGGFQPQMAYGQSAGVAGVKDPCNHQSFAKRWWRGQYLNYHARNQRLANHLFGWMVPSGCCGQGCPPLGKYQVTYANDPGYADHRDNGQAYGVQGYGVPLSVPLAPTVRQSYNYSWGTPSSRITPLGNYTPQTSVRPLYHQSW
ncbi:MAG TPA: hypothetical protein EYG03_27620 [Planctomycetes bacterium]|nr:hypothetical protein [Fuerstiella sp.]HIK95732.1 hypothetical protein [Planctomycetota bacterium]